MTRGHPYSAEFKANLVRRICKPGGPTAYQVALEEGLPQATLYNWVNKATRSAESMSKRNRKQRTPAAPQARRPQDWRPAEKLEAVVQTGRLSEEELGIYLRENGLHEAHLQEWRQQAEGGLGRAPSTNVDKQLRKENQRLSKELGRKNRALAEAAALLVLSKKARALWGDEGENT
jgi:transposase-like protein